MNVWGIMIVLIPALILMAPIFVSVIEDTAYKLMKEAVQVLMQHLATCISVVQIVIPSMNLCILYILTTK